MENQIYSVVLYDNYKLDFFICESNDLNPYKEIKELGIVVYKDDLQIDGDLTINEIDSLIDYLTKAKAHISDFNKN